MKIVKGLLLGACVVTALLSACGGGGSDSGTAASTGGTAVGSASIVSSSNSKPNGNSGTTTASGGNGSTGGAAATPTPTPNPAPTPTPTVTLANAGPAKNVVVGSTVALDGTASTVASGRSLTYAWTFVSPSGHAISAANTARPSFIADAVGAFTLQLAVNDGVSTSTSRVTVNALAASASVNASIVASRVSGVAPLSVFFDATATTALSTSKPFNDLEYQWSFGESNLGNWSVGARANSVSRNVDSGPVASHVFETPGTYTVTLSATDGTNVDTKTVQITVTDPNAVFASTTACVSASGAFTGCPASAAKITSSDYAAVINGNASVRRFLFNRGESFTASTQAREVRNGPGIIGAYGSGAAPRWAVPAGKTGLVLSDSTTPTNAEWRVMDIEMDGQSLGTSGVTAGGSMSQVLLLRLNIHNINVGITFDVSLLDYYNGAQGGNLGVPMWDQVAIVDTRVNTIFGGVGVSVSSAAAGYYGGYISSNRLTFMGNNFDNANGGEHVLRTPYVGRGVFSHNYLARPDNVKHCFKLHAPSFGGTGTVGGKYSEKVVIADNTFDGGKSQQNLKLAPQNSASDERVRNVIVERNYFLMGANTTSALVVQGPVSAVSVRNNIVNGSNSIDPYPADFTISGDGMGPTTSIDIYNNTFYTTGSYFKGILVGGNAALVSGVNVKNNLGYAPSVPTANFVNVSSSIAAVSSNNSSDAQLRGVSPKFSTVPAASSKSLSASDFAPTAGSYAIGAGAVVPVLSDFFLSSRAAGTASDMGAVLH